MEVIGEHGLSRVLEGDKEGRGGLTPGPERSGLNFPRKIWQTLVSRRLRLMLAAVILKAWAIEKTCGMLLNVGSLAVLMMSVIFDGTAEEEIFDMSVEVGSLAGLMKFILSCEGLKNE